jgi:2-hydroxy-6-oxonona-2,4-dienedioate hydrolase
MMSGRAGAARVRSILRRSGHAASLANGRIPAEFIAWRLAGLRDTDEMRGERDMSRGSIISWTRPGWRRGVVLADAELGAITEPTLYVYGTADGIAPVDFARHVVDLLLHGELHLVEGGGHEPWFEDIPHVASRISQFLALA